MEATDPSTTPKRLKEIWNLTTSTRVRKAVVSNGNTDATVMAMGARLYLKEVVTNPSFVFLKLFGEDDGFITDLHDSYEDPQKFLKNKSLHHVKMENRPFIARALLLSPRLQKYQIIADVWRELSAAEFYRELKDPDVKERVRAIILSNFAYVKLAEIANFYKNGLVELKELGSYLEGLEVSNRRNSHQTLTKGSYFSFITDLVKQGIDNYTYSLVFRFVGACTTWSIKNLASLVETNSDLKSDGYMQLISLLYRDFTSMEVLEGVHNREGSHSRQLCKLLWKIIYSRNAGETFGTVDFTGIYRDVVATGLNSDLIPHVCFLPLKDPKNFIQLNALCRQLLLLQSDDAFAFFLNSVALKSEWVAVGHPDNPETQVVTRLHAINEGRFRNGLHLLYDRTELGVYPTIYVGKRGPNTLTSRYKTDREIAKEISNGLRTGLVDVERKVK